MSQPRGLPRRIAVNVKAKLVMAGFLALSAADVGLWATFTPRSFYRSFPLPGHHWVALAGPYDEHLVRDVGGLYLALLVITVWVAVRPTADTLRMVGSGWLVFHLAHLAFHLDHLDGLSTADKIGNVVSLSAVLLLALVLVLPERRAAID